MSVVDADLSLGAQQLLSGRAVGWIRAIAMAMHAVYVRTCAWICARSTLSRRLLSGLHYVVVAVWAPVVREARFSASLVCHELITVPWYVRAAAIAERPTAFSALAVAFAQEGARIGAYAVSICERLALATIAAAAGCTTFDATTSVCLKTCGLDSPGVGYADLVGGAGAVARRGEV